MIEFFKKLFRIVKNYDSHQMFVEAEITHLNSEMKRATDFIRERTEIHADIHMKSPAQVVMIGRYHGKDFVNIYDVGQGEFESLLEHLKQIDRYARPSRFDSPWPMVNAVIEREFRH